MAIITKTQIKNARKLAKDILRIENDIQSIIDKGESRFDISHDEDHGWIVHTAYCQMGGCTVNFVPADCKESAKKLAAEMTLRGLTPNTNGCCASCSEDLY
jgi:hypothetical protein